MLNRISSSQVDLIKKQLGKAKKVIVFTHLNPDGDAIGSALGLYHYLKDKGYDVSVICPNHFPQFLSWMKDSNKIMRLGRDKKKIITAFKEAELIFSLDFNSLSRTGDLKTFYVNSRAYKILVDHHPDPENFNDLVLSNSTISSAAELVMELIIALEDTDSVTPTIAECLYTGIMTDTGCFSFNSSQPRTFEIVVLLLKTGFDKDKIFNMVYESYSFDRMRLMGYCLYHKLKLLPECNAGYIYISQEELSNFNFQVGDTEGFVNLPFSIKDLVLSALFIEKKGYVKVSLRSRGNFNVNEFAKKHFNGGGHKNAAGGEIHKSLEESLQLFEKLVLKHRKQLSG